MSESSAVKMDDSPGSDPRERSFKISSKFSGQKFMKNVIKGF